jgi:hypothetical protein
MAGTIKIIPEGGQNRQTRLSVVISRWGGM